MYSSSATGAIAVAGSGSGDALAGAEQSTAAWAVGTRARPSAAASAKRCMGCIQEGVDAASLTAPQRLSSATFNEYGNLLDLLLISRIRTDWMREKALLHQRGHFLKRTANLLTLGGRCVERWTTPRLSANVPRRRPAAATSSFISPTSAARPIVPSQLALRRRARFYVGLQHAQPRSDR
ncbi:hypothetical protein D3C71_1546440 [compost metagenome]